MTQPYDSPSAATSFGFGLHHVDRCYELNIASNAGLPGQHFTRD